MTDLAGLVKRLVREYAECSLAEGALRATVLMVATVQSWRAYRAAVRRAMTQTKP